MLPVILIAALILLESRDVFNGFLSQPFAVSVLLILFLNYDPSTVLTLALATHLIYLDSTPSGASLYPEYPFAFFIVISSFGTGQLSFSGLLNAVILIIFLSKITAFALNKKRHLFEKHREFFVFYHKFPGLVPSLFFSLMFLALYSGVVYSMLKWLISTFEKTGVMNYCSDILLPGHILLLCLILVFRSALKNIRFKNA